MKTWIITSFFRPLRSCWKVLPLVLLLALGPVVEGMAPHTSTANTKRQLIVPNDHRQWPVPSVSFKGIQGVFAPIDFAKIDGMELAPFVNKMEQQIPVSLRSRFRHHAPMALEMAQKHRVDPFWAIAVMWVESHFKSDAVSSVGARGLMQVMPKTGSYLAGKLKAINYGPLRRREYVEYTRPQTNIEMGVFYLSYLARKFASKRDNHALATIAYNMGPGQLQSLLRRKYPIRKRSRYLKKVRKAYFNLLRPFQGDHHGKTASSTGIRQSKDSATVF